MAGADYTHHMIFTGQKELSEQCKYAGQVFEIHKGQLIINDERYYPIEDDYLLEEITDVEIQLKPNLIPPSCIVTIDSKHGWEAFGFGMYNHHKDHNAWESMIRVIVREFIRARFDTISIFDLMYYLNKFEKSNIVYDRHKKLGRT